MSGPSPSQTRTSHASASMVEGHASLIEPFYRPSRLSTSSAQSLGGLSSPAKSVASPMTSPHTPAASLAPSSSATSASQPIAASPLSQPTMHSSSSSIWSSRVPDHRNSVGALTPRYQTSYSFSGPSNAADSEAYRNGGAAWGAASQPQQRSYSDSGRFFGVITPAIGSSAGSSAGSFSSASTVPRRSSTGIGTNGTNGAPTEPLLTPLLNTRPQGAPKNNFTGPAISLLDQFSSLASATRHAELTRRVDSLSVGSSNVGSAGGAGVGALGGGIGGAGPSPAASAPGSPPSGLRRPSLGLPNAIPEGIPSPKISIKPGTWNPQSSSFVYAPQYTPPEHPQVPSPSPPHPQTPLTQPAQKPPPISHQSPSHAHHSNQHHQRPDSPEGAGNRPPVRRRDYRRTAKHSELPLLEDLRTNRKTLTIAAVLGNVLEVSTDQHGSRFIQENLAAAPDDVRAEFFVEATKNLLQLMMDVFGNYVIQQLFELGTMAQRSEMVRQMRGKVLVLSLQMYGCRVVQMALRYSAPADKVAVVNELDGHVVRCIKDHNGNHVIQKAVECISSEHVQFVYASLLERTVELSKHMYGCRVVQRILEHADEATKQQLLSVLRDNIAVLVEDQYGNYVVQHIVDHGPAVDRQAVLAQLMPHVLELSTHKYASNVVEKCFIRGSARQRRDMIDRILMTPSTPGSVPVIVSMIKDQYANYVVQKILGTADAEDRARLTAAIRPHLASLKRSAVGKHLATIERLVG